MKKIVSLMLVLMLLVGMVVPVFANDNEGGREGFIDITKEFLNAIIDEVVEQFTDIKKGDWYSEMVARLYKLGGIDGYTDGTFKPNESITRAEFTKLLLGTLGEEEENFKDGHWAQNWIDRAYSMKILDVYDKDEFSAKNLNEKITRQEMAKMAVLASMEYTDKYKLYEKNIKDLHEVDVLYKDYVLKAYETGLIGGYPDGTFRPKEGATRAEASTIAIRIIDKKERLEEEPLGKIIYPKEPELAYIVELAKKYPNNSTIWKKYNWLYHSEKKPKNNEESLFLVKEASTRLKTDYDLVLYDDYTKNDLEVFKEILKRFYPNDYSKVYKSAVDLFKKADDSNSEGYYDGRYTYISREKKDVAITIGKEGIQWD